jgi:hypothetical protein
MANERFERLARGGERQQLYQSCPDCKVFEANSKVALSYGVAYVRCSYCCPGSHPNQPFGNAASFLFVRKSAISHSVTLLVA